MIRPFLETDAGPLTKDEAEILLAFRESPAS